MKQEYTNIDGSPRTFTVADVANASGAKTRSVQHWTLNAALYCDPETKHEGSGVRRRYSAEEAAIACVLAKVAQRTISVGELIKIGDTLRDQFSSNDLFLEVLSGKRGISLILDCDGNGEWSARLQSGGINVIKSEDYGDADEYMTWRFRNVAKLFEGIL